MNDSSPINLGGSREGGSHVTLQANFSGPLYQQVHESLKSKITNGEWKGGMVIPGDAELSRQLGVSIGTVRKALDELARQRLVVRERGRGTFIKEPSDWCGDFDTWLCDEAGRPIDAEISVVDAQLVGASSAEQNLLQMTAERGRAPHVHKILRVWRFEGRVVCTERALVDAARLPRLREEADLAAPIITASYLQRLRRPVGRVVWLVNVRKPDAALQELFARDMDDVNLSFRRVLCDVSDVPIEVSELLIELGENSCRISN